ncbi:MAG: rhomboid family intramembrane serine protease [Planctomycetes bacterium]|nr:rhomboid family intramembrane serine protease [Planctomycetota bacterium]
MIIIPFSPEAEWRHRPVGTWLLIAVNVFIHLLWTSRDPACIQPWTIDFQAIDPVQWLSSAFLHGDWLHLVGNMVFLYVFGQVVEDFTGRWFLPLYLLLAGGSGALVQIVLLNRGEVGHALGASSAIYGLVVLALLWAPEIRLKTLFWLFLARPFVREVRILWMALYYLAWEVAAVLISRAEVNSPFLHFCGILVAVPVGLLCLREKWVQTDGLDLPALWMGWGSPAPSPASAPVPVHATMPGVQSGGGLTAPASAASPSAPRPPEPEGPVDWEEQVVRITAAIEAGRSRVAWAALGVLRSEHPERRVDSDLIYSLAACCEASEDHQWAMQLLQELVKHDNRHRDLAWLAIARIRTFRRDEPEGGRAALGRVRVEALDSAKRTEYQLIQERIARRLRLPSATTRIGRAVGGGPQHQEQT